MYDKTHYTQSNIVLLVAAIRRHGRTVVRTDLGGMAPIDDVTNWHVRLAHIGRRWTCSAAYELALGNNLVSSGKADWRLPVNDIVYQQELTVYGLLILDQRSYRGRIFINIR